MSEIDVKQELYFNGVGADGEYLFLPMSPEEVAKVASRQTVERKDTDPAGLSELKWRHKSRGESHYGVKEGINPEKLEETGWGVILPAAKVGSAEAIAQQQILEALKPLLDLRREQATKKSEKFFQIFKGELGYCPGESKQKYLARLGVGPGPADPNKGVPYYLLIVGSPQSIPYHVQYQIDVQYAVGRIHFDTLAEYQNYARSVVAAEQGGARLAKEVAFLGVANPDDPATQLSRKLMVGPLADLIEKQHGAQGWQVKRYFDDAASRQTLEQILGGSTQLPALLYTGSHGMGFKNGDSRQFRQQGALLCQDWPGPKEWHQPLREDFYFSADHLRSDANLLGMIAFNFACYGGGSPQYDEFVKQSFATERKEIAPAAFVAGLPKKMLGLANGAALACIGHVERAWGCSFLWDAGQRGGPAPQLTVFESAMSALLKGMPVGAALEYFNARYAELSSDLAAHIESMEFGNGPDPYVLSDAWTANNDARSYAITGDPAVRLHFGNSSIPRGNERIELSSGGAAAHPTPAPATAPAPSAAQATTASFGLLSSDVKGEGSAVKAGGFQQLIEKIASTMFSAVQDMSRLEVRTYASSNVSATSNQGREALLQSGQLRAFTRIMLDGDIDAVVPQQDGVANKELWGMHLELVKQAQAHRAEILKALLALIKGS